MGGRTGGERTDRDLKRQARLSAKKTARKRGVYIDLTIDEVPDIPLDCPLCGQAMVSGQETGRGCSPSLDRILPGLGYVPHNLWWVCHDCNRQKSDLDPARAYDMWDRVWAEVKARGLPLPSTRLRPSLGGAETVAGQEGATGSTPVKAPAVSHLDKPTTQNGETK